MKHTLSANRHRTTLAERNDLNQIGAVLLKRYNNYKRVHPVTTKGVARMVAIDSKNVYEFLVMERNSLSKESFEAIEQFLTDRGF